MSNEILSSTHINKIGEILNIGMTSAANTMSGILNKTVSISNPKSEITKLSNIKYFGYENGLILGFNHTGSINGKIIAMFRKMDMDSILHILMDTGSDDDIDDYEIDELTIEVIREISNQMSNAFSVSLGEFFVQKIGFDTDDIKIFQNINSIAEVLNSDIENTVDMVDFQITINEVLTSKMMIIVTPDFYNSVAEKLNVNSDVENTNTDISNNDDEINETGNADCIRYADNIETTVLNEDVDAIHVHKIQFPDFTNQKVSPLLKSALTKENNEILKQIPLMINVEIGRTKRKMKEIMSLAQGDVIILEKRAGAPVDIIVNGQSIAKGDVMVIDDNFGVRITEIVSIKD